MSASPEVIPVTSTKTEITQTSVVVSDVSHQDDIGFGFFEDDVELTLAIENQDFGFFDEAFTAKEISVEDINKTLLDTPLVTNTEPDDDLGFGFFESLTPESVDSEIDALVHIQANKAIAVIEHLTKPINSPSAPKIPRYTGNTAESTKVAPADPVDPAPVLNKSVASSAKSTPTAATKKVNTSTQDATLRVETSKIDTLVNLAGELVITQSMLTLIGNEISGELGERLKTALVELERNTREMQEAVMSVRMLPVSFVFNRFHRLVRDLSDQLGKNVNLVIEGGNTEIDKGMIEKLVDPLTHLVRNSLDHGIEKPEVRRLLGKAEIAELSLRASQRGGNIVIAVHDDGAGLHREKIIQKARENNMSVTDNMPDKQIWQLIFAAGFSTAQEITDVSGRGVGMDVVRRNIEALGGRIDIDSVAGQGATFEIQLPLTLAIVDGMSVSVGNQIYILPLVHIIESIQPHTEQLKYLVQERLIRVREEYLPLLNLHQLMEITPFAKCPEEGIVVLLESNNKRFGLCVDALVGQQQVVIKSLEKHYRRIPGVSGATIMGDGSVALILDVESLAQQIKN